MNLREIATGGDPRKALATKFFQSQQAEAFLSIVAHRERRIMGAVADLQRAVDDDDLEPIEGLPSVDDRVEQIPITPVPGFAHGTHFLDVFLLVAIE